jgi:hypothetical protein
MVELTTIGSHYLYQYYGSPAYPHARSSYGATGLWGVSELLRVKNNNFHILKVGEDGLLGYNLLGALFTIGYLYMGWDCVY